MKVPGLLTVLASLALAGCSDDTVLFSGMTEQHSNSVVARLAQEHIAARKQIEKAGITVIVANDDVNRAVRVLDAAGLPHQTRTSLGEIFKKEGVISTPLEERARYIYALSQELESTLSQIDGVIVARVHVVLPERIAPGEPVQPASASVFIKYAASALDPDSVRGRIQQMVASSIPGMSQESNSTKKFSIVFVPSMEFQDPEHLVSFGPFLIDSKDAGFWWGLIIALPLGLVFAAGVSVLMLRPDWRQALLTRLRARRRTAGLPAQL
ncbi:type III secretion system inner membrane ring lipoprotein SctJ [Pseudomonas sp. NFACC37-1]|uniref:type III secretion system inner membrane ring lipoprotein SctJ n=1 Tax=Pseudomonas sp. NFACC37-1 TaxID=1566196 RepID=UPI000887E80F|nr:type III secretion inner membrane ring lipoprotein SctJ [Pseudomonas sp. NFACC37-1]SCX85442.1 type III secretion protein J [Pseudomonas sp. NFACC37-1]